MPDPKPGVGGTFYLPFPVLGLASDGGRHFMAAGGGGAVSKKEVPNEVHALSYDEGTAQLKTVAALNTDADLVVALSYNAATNLWLASSRTGCKILSFDPDANTITELGSWESESAGKEPEQNFAKFSHDGRLIVTGGTDGFVKVWHHQKPPGTPQLQHTFSTEGKEVLDADFSHDAKHVATSDAAGCCRVWDLSKAEGEGNGAPFSFESAHVKGKTFAKLVRFFQAVDGTPALVIGACGGRGPAVVALFALSGQKLAEVNVDKQPIKSMALDTDNARLLVGLMSGAKAVYTMPTLKKISKTKELHSLPAQGVVFVGEGTAVSGSGDRDVHMHTVRQGGGFSMACMFLLLLILGSVCFMLFRIADKGAAVGQGGPASEL